MAILTDSGVLDMRRSPYRHNRYPFTPIWGYRRARDRLPYGMIRDVRDINRDLNKRASKALHHLSTTRVLTPKGAVDDIETLRDEAARPDSVIEYNQNVGIPTIQSDTNIAAAHIELMSTDAQMIQAVAGVTDENMGRTTNAKSGIAIERRQTQGALTTAIIFENLRRSRLLAGEKLLVLIEMFYDKQEEFRITDTRGNADFKTINDGSLGGAIANHKSDFIIDEEDWRASARQAQADALLELCGKLAPTAPQIIVSIIDLVVEALDVPKRDEIVKRIRNVTGSEDPDADPNNPTPEMQAKAEEAAKQKDMADRQMSATVQEAEAKARKLTAEANATEGKSHTDYIARVKAAFEAALAIAGAPAVAAAADQILQQAMQEEAATAPIIPPAAAMMPQQAPAQPQM